MRRAKPTKDRTIVSGTAASAKAHESSVNVAKAVTGGVDARGFRIQGNPSPTTNVLRCCRQ